MLISGACPYRVPLCESPVLLCTEQLPCRIVLNGCFQTVCDHVEAAMQGGVSKHTDMGFSSSEVAVKDNAMYIASARTRHGLALYGPNPICAGLGLTANLVPCRPCGAG
jgi:hypothetical protein